LAKVQGSVVPLSAGTPLPSTPATATVPTQPPAPPPRTSTPTPVPRGVKREFEDSALAQPNTQGPGPVPATISSSGSVSPTSGQVQRPGAAKAGVPGARPRPLKKQRVVSYGFTLLKTTQTSGEGSRSSLASTCDPFQLWCLVSIRTPPPWLPYYSGLCVADLYLLVTNRTCKAKRETCTRFRQYNSLLHRACDIVRGCMCPFLEWCMPICCLALVHWQVATRCNCATKPNHHGASS